MPSASRLLASLDLHYRMAQRTWPSLGITYRSPLEWMPAAAVTFEDLVEHLSREALQAPATPALVLAAGFAVQADAKDVITADHVVVRSKFGALLATILDSPLHVKR